MRLVPLGLLGCLALSALSAGEPPAFDCLTQEPAGKDQAPFFICLNIRREGCGELLRKMQAECGQESAKYKLAFDRYLALRTRANLLLDTVASDMRLGRKPKADDYSKAMVEVAEAVRGFEGMDKGLTCEGTPTRILAELASLITPALSEKIQAWVKAWIGGKKEERDARAAELVTQRWKLPSELGAPFPGKPAATTGS